MKIAKDTVVRIHYTPTGDDGTQYDTSRNGEPLEYIHGNGNLIPGLEMQLEGRQPGDVFTAVVQPFAAYGEREDNLVVDVPRSQFDADLPLSVGMKFQADTASGPMIVTVIRLSDDTVTVDGNHELAGKTLHFAVEVVSVRAATAEELLPTTAHAGCAGCSGCGSGNMPSFGCSGCGCQC